MPIAASLDVLAAIPLPQLVRFVATKEIVVTDVSGIVENDSVIRFFSLWAILALR